MTDDDLRALVPKNKTDDSSVLKLNSLSYKEIKPIIPYLLVWIQDLNWPIALKIWPVLGKHLDKLTKEVASVFESNDDDWKYGILHLYLDYPFTSLNKPIIDILTAYTDQTVENDEEYEFDKICTIILINNALSKVGVYIQKNNLVILKKNRKEHCQISLSSIKEISLENFDAPFHRITLFWLWRLSYFQSRGYLHEIDESGIDYRRQKELVFYLKDDSHLRKEIFDFDKGLLTKTVNLLNSILH